MKDSYQLSLDAHTAPAPDMCQSPILIPANDNHRKGQPGQEPVLFLTLRRQYRREGEDHWNIIAITSVSVVPLSPPKI